MGCKLEAEGGVSRLGTGPQASQNWVLLAWGLEIEDVVVLSLRSLPPLPPPQHRPCSQDQARDVNTGIQP